MKRPWAGYVLLGLLLYGLFLFAFAPASWVAWGVSHLSRGAVALGQAQGTVWSGGAELVASTTRRDLGHLRWRINPAWLLTGRVNAMLDLSGPGTQLSTTLRVGIGGIRVRNAIAHVSPAFAAVFYLPLALVDPAGNVEVRTDDLFLTSNAIEGEVNLLWRGAAGNVSNVRPLGDYELKLSGKNRKVDIALLTRVGPLNLAGNGSWLPFDGGRLEFSGIARATGRQAELAPLLQVLGAQSSGEARLLIRTAFALR